MPIELGLIRKFLFFPFIHPIFCTFKTYGIIKIENMVSENGYDVLMNIFRLVSIHACLLLQIIPEIISRSRQKRINFERISTQYENSNLIFRDYSKFNINIFLLILFSSVLYYSAYGVRLDNNYLYLGRFGLMFWLAFWSYFILGVKISGHQFIGIIFIIIGTIFLVLINILINDINDLNSLDVFTLFSSFVLFCLSIVMKKYLLEKYYVSPFFILLLEGIIGIIIDFIIIAFLIKSNFIQIEEIKNFCILIYNSGIMYWAIIYFIFSGITEMCIMITNFYFTPTMIGVSDYISIFFEGILSNIHLNLYIGIIIIIIGCFIYNELIILKCYNLEIHTQKYISSRSSKDIDFLYSEDSDYEIYN